MPNKNYLAGRRFEYEVMQHWRDRGYEVIRASGSHGAYDVVAFKTNRKPEFIQCKVVQLESRAKALLATFKKDTQGSNTYHQVMMIKIKGGELIQGTI